MKHNFINTSNFDFSSLKILYHLDSKGLKWYPDGWSCRFNANGLLSCRKTHTNTHTFPQTLPVESVEVLSVDVCISSHIQQLNYQSRSLKYRPLGLTASLPPLNSSTLASPRKKNLRKVYSVVCDLYPSVYEHTALTCITKSKYHFTNED